MKDLRINAEKLLKKNARAPMEIKYVFQKNRRRGCGRWTLLVCAIILLILSSLCLIWTPFRTLMDERLRMRPGFPPYEWWKNPPDEVLLRVYIFNITNANEFLNGEHNKLKVEEIGPIVFMERLTHSNVTFNPNDTLTYVAERRAVFLPEKNALDMNATLMVPNLAVLGMASYFWDSSFVTKIAFNLLLRSLESRAIVSTTIYNYLWNFSDPILDVGQSLAPSLVPVNNLGVLNYMYSNFKHNVTVKIGTIFGSQNFFLIDQFDGSGYLPNYGRECSDKLVDSTEGVAYPQFLTKNTTLSYWRKTICKVVRLNYESDVNAYGVTAYRFVLDNTTFNRRKNDCHVGNPPLPDGLSDVSKCYYNLPMASSFPHFLYTRSDYVEGLQPDVNKHGSYVIVEPVTGIPLESRARLQSNLIVNELYGFNDVVEKFSNTVVPMFWAEYNQVGLPYYITALMFFTVNVVPYVQVVAIVAMIVGGVALAIISGYKFSKRWKSSKHV
ncbi:hypothetical protein FQR65_LT00244 [Abscondita terminalis]|nr:hypothetical protein FQR65_LT00244 [Abscondita terminalis]